MTHISHLTDPVSAQRIFKWVWDNRIKEQLAQGQRLVLEVRPSSKTRHQEQKYHAMIGDIATQAQHLGASWGPEDWKRLLLDKFARETERTHGQIIPNLDKSGVVEVGVQSRKFTRRDGVEFIEWLYAWGAENGIVWQFQDVMDDETREQQRAVC